VTSITATGRLVDHGGEHRRELLVLVDDAQFVADTHGQAALGEGGTGDPRGLLGHRVNGMWL
jgi:hypothetical protein